MRASKILAASGHRPWPPPAAPWVMAQRWHDLLFAHWPLPPEVLRPLVPGALPLDTLAGQAWLGIVPFRMSGVRPRFLPAVSWLSDFPELNVRTYVTLDGKPGVYFFSLDAGNPVATVLARWFAHLPYYHATMRCVPRDGGIEYVSRRAHRHAAPAEFHAFYRPTGPTFHAAPDSLDYWLTERYCFYAPTADGRIYRCEVAHAQWVLQPAELVVTSNTMADTQGIPLPETPPLLHFAKLQEVLVWWPERITKSGWPAPDPPPGG